MFQNVALYCCITWAMHAAVPRRTCHLHTIVPAAGLCFLLEGPNAHAHTYKLGTVQSCTYCHARISSLLNFCVAFLLLALAPLPLLPACPQVFFSKRYTYASILHK